MNDHGEFDRPPEARLAPPEGADSMDDRLRRLENAIAALQDTRLMEQRLLERVSQRLEEQPPSNSAGSDSHALVEAGKAVLPGMIRAMGSHLGAATSPTAPDSHSVFAARTWIVTDIVQEIRTFFVLYFDYRYRPSWPARIVPPAGLALFILGWVFKYLFADNFVGALLEHTLNLCIVVLVYKTLQREAARYRAHFAYLPPI